MRTKFCHHCQTVKPLDDFYNHRRTPDGKTSQCKVCMTSYRTSSSVVARSRVTKKENYIRNRARVLTKRKEYVKISAAKIAAYLRTPDGKAAIARANRRQYEKNKTAHNERSREHARANVAMHRAYKHSYKSKKRSAFVEAVDVAEVYERDMGLCQICGLPVGPGEFHLDHRIPISRGGKHSMLNTQTSHATCNLRKNDKLPSECAHLWLRG